MKRIFLNLLYRIYSLQWIVTRPFVIGVRVLLIRDDQVLLVKHAYQSGWYLPGGGVKRNETPEQAARRECCEEVGAEIGSLELFGIFAQFIEHKSDHIIVFVGHDFSLIPKKNFEIERVELFNVNDLPTDIKSGNKRRIEEYLRGERRLRAGMW
jgi:8-oxo-dGTP pyrophosphatase MutT (NUDIX family)